MIKIHNKLWYIIRKPRDGWNDDDRLSYMTYFGNNKAFENRKETGVRWSRRKEEDGIIVDNKPMNGFEIVDSVQRWSTSNKLFRVYDPKGFVVEIPTGNLATLLKYVTVVNGVIQDECVWGREGSNHILLPVNSPPYLETVTKMATLHTGLIKPKDLTIGDVVNVFDCGEEYELYFAGRGKVTWTNQRTGETVQDGWRWLFCNHYTYRESGDHTSFESPNTKVVKVVRNEPFDWFAIIDKSSWTVPTRILNKFTQGTTTEELRERSYFGSRYRTVRDDIHPTSVEYKQ